MFVLWLSLVTAPDLFVAQKHKRGAAWWQSCEREAGADGQPCGSGFLFVLEADVLVLQCVIIAVRTTLDCGNNGARPVPGAFGNLSADTATNVWGVGSACVTERSHGGV